MVTFADLNKNRFTKSKFNGLFDSTTMTMALDISFTNHFLKTLLA